LREFLERHGQAYVLRVACTFMLELGDGARLTCRQAVARLLGQLPWEVRSAGAGSKGQRWYAWAGIATACPHHLLLVRRHLRTGDLAFHYCYLPDGRALGEPEDQAAMDQADAEVHDELAGEDG